MMNASLFLGFPTDASFDKALDNIDANILSIFINNHADYLKEVTHEGIRYIGKYVGGIAHTSQLALLEVNIYSLIKKIVPNYTVETIPLELFAIECH